MCKLLQMDPKKRRKIFISGVSAILLLLLYGLIFSFSEQDGETSGGISLRISQKCVEFFNALSGKGWSQIVMKSMAEYFENPIRKLAHFGEYAVMGVLLFGVWYPWLGFSKKPNEPVKKKAGVIEQLKKLPLLVKIIIPWIFISAALDEIHQLFVPDRWGSFWDVLLDTAGGCFGLSFCIFVVKMYHKRNRKKL